MDPGTGFIVGESANALPKKHLYIKNNSNVHNASTSLQNNSPIWQGIDVDRSGDVEITGNSKIRGALVAVRVKHPQASLKFNGSTFENNFISLAANGQFVNNGISGNTFKGPQNSFSPMAPNFTPLSLDNYISDEIPGLAYSTIRPFAGIFLEQSTLNIFDANTFIYLANGIWMKNWNSNINNCIFTAMRSGMNLDDYTGNGIRLINVGRATYRNLDRNSFTICDNSSVNLDNSAFLTYFKSQMIGSNFSKTAHNIKLTRGLKKDPLAPLEYSRISTAGTFCRNYGVCATQTGNDINYLKIQNGDYYTGSGSSCTCAGIYLNNLASLPYPNNSVEVRENNFFPVQFQSPLNKLYDIHLDNSSNLRVFNNAISTSQGFPNPIFSNNIEGISVVAGEKNLIDCNNVQGREADVSVSYIIDNSPSNLLLDNIASYTSDGLRFSGICNTESYVRFTAWTHNDFGLVYEPDGITGLQYLQGNPIKSVGNEWFGQDWEPAGGYIGARHKGALAVAQQSVYKVPPKPTGNYGSSQNPFEYQMDQGVDPSLWFQEDAQAYWDDYVCPEHLNATSYINPYIGNLDRKIASGQKGLEAYTSPGYMWLHDYYLYRKVKDNPGIATSEPQVLAFISAREYQPLGKLYQVEKSIRDLYQVPSEQQNILDSMATLIHSRIVAISAIDSILIDTTLSETARQQWVDLRSTQLQAFNTLQNAYSLASLPIEQNFSSGLAAIVSQNNAILSSYPWELNQKFVNHILLERIIPQATISIGELNQLYSIAASCPEFGGWAVYDARSYYAWLTDSIVPKATCMPIQVRSDNKPTAQVHGINISPNPASDFLTVSCENFDVHTRFRLIDMVGRVWLDMPVTQNVETIELKGCVPGIYFAQILNGERLIATPKVIITR
jgi:Secretion system C-terminal sorting domain